jgi:hypothetical protein
MIEGLLQENLPFDVATFLKEMLSSRTLSQKEKVLIGNALIQVYQRNRQEDQRSATIRQQACHYLTTLGTEQAIHALEEVLEREPDKWVQRGIMVGLAIHCERADMLESYIQILRTDPEAPAINLIYHLIYYGDHHQEVGYDLQGIDTCDKTVAAIFRHLGDDRCRNGWALDLFTLSTLLELQGISVLAAYSRQQPFLKGFLSTDHSRGQLLAEEQERLHTLLERETSFHGNERDREISL